MKINEVVTKAFGTKLFKARVRINQGSYKQLIDTTVVAKNLQMAIKLLKAQYGKDSVVGNPKIIQDLTEGSETTMRAKDFIQEGCEHGRYYCSTDKKWKCRQGPKQTRASESVEQGVAEDSGNIGSMIQQYEDMVELVYDLPPGRKKNIAIDKRDALEAQIEAMPGGKEALRKWAREYNDSFDESVAEEKQRLDPKCWTGYKKQGTKMKGGVRVNNCVKISESEYTLEGEVSMWYDDQLNEAEYQGRKVPLGKPMQGDVKKFKVYVKNEKGNVVKVNFGDPNMRIKKSNPARRKSFRARHNCDNPGPRTKARYWSCRKW